MKKITLSVGLLIGIMSVNAQDTICNMVNLKHNTKFNYKTDKIINVSLLNKDGTTTINVRENEVLALWLRDLKSRTRKITIYFPDGKIIYNIFDSKDNVIYSPIGPFKVKVGKSKLIQKL